MSAPYTMTMTVDLEPAEAESRLRDALAGEGFGILSEIDVQETLRNKLGEDIGVYRILGACNPQLARRAIASDPEIGALLPCNVVVRAGEDGGSVVSAADPDAMLSIGARGLEEVAAEARSRLQRALDTVAAL